MEFKEVLSPRTDAWTPTTRQPGRRQPDNPDADNPDADNQDRSSLLATSRGLRDQTSQARKDLSDVSSFPDNACESR